MKKQKSGIFGDFFERFNNVSKNHDNLMSQMQSRTNASDNNIDNRQSNRSRQKKRTPEQQSSQKNNSKYLMYDDDHLNGDQLLNAPIEYSNSIDSNGSIESDQKNVAVYDKRENDLIQNILSLRQENMELISERDSIKDEYKDFKKEYDKLCDAYDQLYKDHEESKELLREVSNTNVTLNNKIKRDRDRIENCKKMINENKEMVEEFKQQIEKHETKYNSTIKHFKMKMEAMKLENEKIKSESQTKTEHIQTLKDKIETLVQNKTILKQMNDALMKNTKGNTNQSFSEYYDCVQKQQARIEKHMEEKISEWFERDIVGQKIDQMNMEQQMALLSSKINKIRQQMQSVDESTKQKIDYEISNIRTRYEDFSDKIKDLELFVRDHVKQVSEHKWKDIVEPKLRLKIKDLENHFNHLMDSVRKDWDFDSEEPQEDDQKDESDETNHVTVEQIEQAINQEGIIQEANETHIEQELKEEGEDKSVDTIIQVEST